MNSEQDSPMPQQLSFDSTPAKQATLVCRLTIPGRLPSWNEILGMEQWARYKYKQQIQDGFLYELRRLARDCSMRTTCAKNFWSIAADTLALYQATALQKRKLRSANKKRSRELEKKQPSKSSGSKVPF